MTALQAAPSPSALQKNTPDSAANSAPDTPPALQLACRSEAGTAALAQRLAQLALGDDGKHDATAWFNEKNGDDYRHAQTLGCYTGALNRALQNTDDAAARSGELLRQTATAAGVAELEAAAAPAADAPAKIRWVYGQLAPALQNPGDSASRLRAAALPPDADAAALKAFESGWQQGNTP